MTTQTIVKVADSTRSFEQQFADLAHAQLREKSPGLLDYLVGFQCLDVDDDETRAVGLFGAQVGKMWVYLPVFFINGELKGTDLMYLKDQDVFVPNSEDWVNYIVNKKPYVLGEGTDRTMQQQIAKDVPDFSVLRRIPRGGDMRSSFGYRTAAWNPTKLSDLFPKMPKVADWARDGLSMFAVSPADDYYSDLPTLPQFLGSNPHAQVKLAQAMKADMTFGNAVLGFYNTSELFPEPKKSWLLKASLADEEKVAPPEGGGVDDKKQEDVQVIRNQEDAIRQDAILTDSEKEKLISGDAVIRDHRTETSQVYKADFGAKLTNPDQTGVYDLALKDGKMQRVTVVMPPIAIGTGHARPALVIAEKGDSWGYFWPTELWAVSTNDSPEAGSSFNSYVASLPGVKSVKAGKRYALLGPGIEGSIAFKVIKRVDGKDGALDIYVQPITNEALSRSNPGYPSAAPASWSSKSLIGPNREPFEGKGTERFWPPYEPDRSEKSLADKREVANYAMGRHIFVPSADTNYAAHLRIVNDTLFAPPETKLVELGDNWNTWSLSDPGTLADIEVTLVKSGGYEYLDVRKLRNQYSIANQLPINKTAAVVILVKDAGLSEADARSVIDAVDGGEHTFLVKRALMTGEFPEQPHYFDGSIGADAEHPFESDQLIRSPKTDPSVYNTRNVYDTAMRAAQTGQKDVFDTAVIGSLVKATGINEITDKYLSDLIRGEDRLGRILFMLYWHNDEFKDRYGQHELPDLEDALVNCFRQVGDLILFLKADTVEAEPGDAKIDLGLRV